MNFWISILIVIGIFLLLREFWCWYFKLNKISKVLEEQLEEQKNSNALMQKLFKKAHRTDVNKMKKESNTLEE
jgi:high-affinity nickel permease